MTAGNSEIEYTGNYEPKPGSRAFDKSFWTSEVVFDGRARRVVDAAGLNAAGRNVVKLIPYGPNSRVADGVVEDGDLLAYVRAGKTIEIGPNADSLLPFLKGRASHAELCYRAEGRARHASLWDAPNPVLPTDCRMFHEKADNAALGIYRVSLAGYGVDPDREAALKREVRKWKEIVRPVNFPNGDSLNFDPVDFSSKEVLAGIAGKFLARSPADAGPPVDFKLNCVQWTTLVLSLAFCFPLTRKVVAELGAEGPFEASLAFRDGGYAPEGLVGLDELPIPFYTPMEVVGNALDLYLPDEKEAFLDRIKKYPAETILQSRGLRFDQRVVMPSAFILENRLRRLGKERKTKAVFEYVATALPENELVEIR